MAEYKEIHREKEQAYYKGYEDGRKSLLTDMQQLFGEKPNHGYMWICPKCEVVNHSDYPDCPCCGYER